MTPEEHDLEFIKTYIFTPELASSFLYLLGKSKDFELVLTKLFSSLTPDEWLGHKNAIFDFMTKPTSTKDSGQNRNTPQNQSLSEQNLSRMYKLPINYEVLGPSLNSNHWNTYLSSYKNNTFYNRLEPHFLEFAKKQKSASTALHYFKIKWAQKPTKASDMIACFEECGVESVPENLWVEVLQTSFHWSFNEKMKLVEALKIDPTYSADTFVFFLGYKNNDANDVFLKDFSRSSSYSFGKINHTINLSNLSTTGVAWFTDKIALMTHEEIDTFFENKFNLRQTRKYLKSEAAIEEVAKKEYRQNSSQIQDYIYLLAFAKLILNPSNTSVATQLAVSLDAYLSKKMIDSTVPWYKKMQDLIEKEKFRQFLPNPNKSAWAPIYEKVALDKLLANLPKPAASLEIKNRKNKI